MPGHCRRGLNLGQPRATALRRTLPSRCAAGPAPATPSVAQSLKLPQLAIGVFNAEAAACSPWRAWPATAQGSGPAAVSIATTAQAHVGFLLNGRLQVFGMQVHPRRGHDHLALAPRKRSSPLSALRQIARWPATRRRAARRLLSASCPRDCCAPHQYCAVRPSFTAAPHGLPDGFVRHMEGVVQSNQRAGFRQAVALNTTNPSAFQNCSSGPAQRPAAGEHRPNFRPNSGVNIAEAPQRFHAGWPCAAAIRSARPGWLPSK